MFNHVYKRMLEEELSSVNDEIESEKGVSLFSCPNKCITLTSEEALSINYQCPDCGALLTPVDKDKRRLVALEKKKERLIKAMEKLP